MHDLVMLVVIVSAMQFAQRGVSLYYILGLNMLQIRLNKGPSLDGGSGVKSESVTVACPDHLVLADLPVAKGLGSATCAARAKTVGRRSRRQLGERVHFCVRCDFPIAIYGRLTPCEHVFCLDCARSDSMCYLCDERIQKIQTIKLMEGIFICAAPHCLKSFLKKNEFESHIHGSHGDLLQPNLKKEEANESDAYAVKPSAASESSVRAPQKPGFPPSSNPPLNDREERAREQTPLRPLMQPRDGGSQRPDGLNSQNRLPQQRFEGILDPPHYPPPVYYQQPPNFGGSMLPNRPPFGFPPFPSDGAPFYGTPMNYEVTRSDSSTDPGFSETHTHPWPSTSTSTSSVVPFEAMQTDKPLDPQARAAFFQGRNSSKALDPDSKGVLASMPPPPPPGPPPPHLLQQTTQSHDGNNYGWSQQNCDSFGGGL